MMKQSSQGTQAKVALVTGAASGIGRATAIAFARAGMRVAVADVDPAGGEETVALIRRAGGTAFFVRADVSSNADVDAMVKRTVAEYGVLDYAFNNAGTEGVMGPTMDCTEAMWDRVLGVNLKGTWLCMKHEIPHLLGRAGAIVNCASVAGLVGFAEAAAYTASKHGVVGLTRSTALELARAGVRVNAVCPGVIQTPMIDRALGGDPAKIAAYQGAEPVGRFGTPEEIAAAVLWLCSDGASFVTGAAIPVDGGWVAR